MFWYKQIAANTFFQIVARVISSGASFLITLLVARHFGLVGYGDFAKVTSFVTLFYLFIDFGFNPVFLQKDEAKVRFKDLLYLRLLFASVVTGIVFLITFILPYNPQAHIGFSPEVRLGIILFSFTIITEAVVYTSAVIFQRELWYKYFMLASLSGSLVSIAAVFVVTQFSQGLFAIYVCFILGSVVRSGLALFFTRQRVFPINIDMQFAKRLTLDTLPIAFMLICNLIYFRVDILLLSFLKSSQDVGIYDLAYKFFDFLIALPLFLSNTLYPSLLKHEQNNQNLFPRIRKYVLIFIAFSFVVLIPLWIIAPLLGFIQKGFSFSVIPFRILLLSLPAFFASSILQWILIAKKQQLFLAKVYAGLTLVNIGLNIVFIPQYSYIASSVITGVSEVLVFGVLWMKLLKLNFKSQNLKI